MVEMICNAGPFQELCQARPAKNHLGIKFWCLRCKRYVVGDEKHHYILRQVKDLTICEHCGRLTRKLPAINIRGEGLI